MIELKPEQFDRLIPLFEDVPHGYCRAMAVLEHTFFGRVFTDDLDCAFCWFCADWGLHDF